MTPIPESGLWSDLFFELMRLTVKTFAHATLKEVDGYVQRNIRTWMELTYKVIQLNVPTNYRTVLQQAGSSDETSKCIDNAKQLTDMSRPAKCLKWGLRVALVFFRTHAKAVGPSGPGAEGFWSDKERENMQFAKVWKEDYAVHFTKAIMMCLDRPYIPQRSQNLILNVLNEATELSNCFKSFKNEINLVMTKVCFPLISFSETDLQTWQEDPEEFLKSEYAFEDMCKSPRAAAERFVKIVVKHRASAVLMPLLEFTVGVLKNPPSLASIDGALNIMGLLDTVLLKVQKQQKEGGQQPAIVTARIDVMDMLRNYVSPHLSSQYPFLRYRALQTYARYCSRGAFLEHPEDIRVGCAAALKMMLQDSEWILQTHATIELQYFVEPIESPGPNSNHGLLHGLQQAGAATKLYPCMDLLQPVMRDVVIKAVQRAQEFHCDELPQTLSVLTCHYPTLVFPFVGDLLTELVKTLMIDIEDQDSDLTALSCDSMFRTLSELLYLLEKHGKSSQESSSSSSSVSGESEAEKFKQRAFADAGLALGPLFEKVFSDLQYTSFHEAVGTLFALVTQNALPDFHGDLVTLIVRSLYSNYVSSAVNDSQGLGGAKKQLHIKFNAMGCEFCEATHVPLRNLLLRAPRQLMRHPFYIPQFAEFFQVMVHSGEQSTEYSDAHYGNFRYVGATRIREDFVAQNGRAHIMELVYDMVLAGMQKNELEDRFIFQLIVPLFDNAYVRDAIDALKTKMIAERGALDFSTFDLNATLNEVPTPFAPEENGKASAVFGLYCLQKLDNFLELTWRFLNEETTRRILRKTFLDGMLQLMTAFPEFVIDGFFTRRRILNNFLGNAFQQDSFLDVMQANKQRRKVMLCAAAVALRHFSSVSNPTAQEAYEKNLSVSIPHLVNRLSEVIRSCLERGDASKKNINDGNDMMSGLKNILEGCGIGEDDEDDDEDEDDEDEDDLEKLFNGLGDVAGMGAFFDVDEDADIDAQAEQENQVNQLLASNLLGEGTRPKAAEDELGYSAGAYRKMAVPTRIEGTNEKEFLEAILQNVPTPVRAQIGL